MFAQCLQVPTPQRPSRSAASRNELGARQSKAPLAGKLPFCAQLANLFGVAILALCTQRARSALKPQHKRCDASGLTRVDAS